MSPSARRGSACSHMRRFEQLRFVPRIHTSTVIRNGSDLTAYHYVRTGKCKGHLGIHISAHWSLCLYPIMWVLFYDVQENSSQGVKATEDLIHTLSTGFRVTPISTFFFRNSTFCRYCDTLRLDLRLVRALCIRERVCPLDALSTDCLLYTSPSPRD